MEENMSAPMAPMPQPQAPVGSAVFAGPMELLRSAWARYKQHFGLFIGVFLLPIAASIIVGIISGGVLPPDEVPVNLALSLLSAIISVLGQIALFSVIAQPEGSVMDAYRASMKRFFSYLWLIIISGILALGLYMLFVIPGILATVWFALGMFVFIAEDERGMNALLKSKDYVSGHWWGVLGRSIFIGAILLVVFLVIGGGIGALLYALNLPVTGVVIASVAITGILSLLVTPLSYAYLYEMYASLKLLKSEVPSEHSTGRKAKFVVPALVGLALIPIFFASLVLFAGRLGLPVPTLPPLLDNPSSREEDIPKVDFSLPPESL